MAIKLMDIIFVGFNKQVIALDRYTGEKKWVWKSETFFLGMEI